MLSSTEWMLLALLAVGVTVPFGMLMALRAPKDP